MENNDEDIKLYFKRNRWNKFSDIEKTRYRNTYNMYMKCILQGIELPKPDFMQDNKENVVENCNKNKSKTKKRKKVRFKLPLKKYPKRKIPSVDYDEEEIPLLDSYVYCDTCEEEFEKFCPNCGMLLHILNNEVRKGTKDRARKTLPKNLLQIKKSEIHGEGVFALKPIPKGIKFGPYDGLETVQSTSGYAWKIRCGRLVDAKDVRYSNWMRYVNCANNINEQNLVAFQFEGSLYYRSVKEIPIGTELLVYYGENFAKMLNINTKNYFEPVAEKQQKETYACFSCCLGFSSEEYLNMHYKNCPSRIPKGNTVDGPDEGIVPCPFCKIYLTNMEYLKRHLKFCRQRFTQSPNWSHVPDNEELQEEILDKKSKIHNCSQCNYTTNMKSNLLKHFRIHSGEKPYNCSICDRKFTVKSGLKGHIGVHIGKRFECKKCHLRFSTKDNLGRHFKCKHLFKKPFSCNYCSYKTAYSSHLHHHLKVHTKEKPYKCDICKKKFTQNGNLRIHLKCHYDPSIQCQFCSENFTNYDLKLHLKIVHKYKFPFKCEICDKGYAVKQSHRSHMKTHSNIKFNCAMCEYSTHFKSSLKTHCMRKHK